MTAPPRVTLRRARDDDAERLLEWRNDADAVRFSVSGLPVTGEDHKRWFAALRDDPRVQLWIAEEEGIPVGQVRLDITGGVGVVSIAVAASHRGRGVASEMLRAMIAVVIEGKAVRELQAVVHSDNLQSIRAFERVGFRLATATERGFSVLERCISATSTAGRSVDRLDNP